MTNQLFPLRPVQQLADPELKYYVYVLFRPSGEPFYVGMGSGRRWLKHEWRSHNPHVTSIILRAGGQVPKVQVRAGLMLSEALETEIALIGAIGRETNGGPLVNLTDGGDGLFGYRYSDEQRAKMSKARKGRNVWKLMKSPELAREKIRLARTGSTASADAKAKMGASQRGRKHSAETRAKMSASQTGEKHAMFGRKHSEDALERIRTATKGIPKSEETKSKMRAAWANRGSSMLGRTHSDAAKEKMSAANKGIPKSEETKARMRAGQARRRAALKTGSGEATNAS